MGSSTRTEWPTVLFIRKAALTGLPSGIRHEFQVRTENGVGVSAWSNTVTLMVP